MSLFEFLTVTVSIVLALGLVRLIHGLRIASGSVARYWVHLGYVVIFIVVHLMYWWGLWGFQAGVNWNLGRFLYLFMGPMLLYSLASTLIPDDPGAVTCWRDYFYRIHRGLFLVMSGFALHQAFASTVLLGILPMPEMRPAFVFGVAMPFVGAFSKSLRVHSYVLMAMSEGILMTMAASFAPVVR